MNGVMHGTGWSLKYNLLLPALMRLDQYRPVGRIFRGAYRVSALGAARALRLPGVRNIYLRRGLAKNEFMPFLSDIDLLVITDTGAVKKAVESRLMKLRRLIPMLEPQSPVITIDEFHDWQLPARFVDNRSFLYRIMEARSTWEILYSRDSDNPLVSTRRLGRFEIISVVISEILFWHKIVITEYTAYRLGNGRTFGMAQRKRFCWIFMKATTELHNFLQALRNRREPLFTRRQIIESAIEDTGENRWRGFFETNRLIINNRFDPRRSEAYLEEAIDCLAYIYRELYNVMSDMFVHDTAFLNWLQTGCGTIGGATGQGSHPVELNTLTTAGIPDDLNLVAVRVAQLPLTNSQYRVLVTFILRSLAVNSNSAIENGMNCIAEQLRPQGILRDQLAVELVDSCGFRCLGSPRMTGEQSLLALREDGASLLPSLYDRMFTANLRSSAAPATGAGAGHS